jgi:xylulokinase
VSLLGIDVGTTGCKALAVALDGRVLASAYQEYDVARPQTGWAELDPVLVWNRVRHTIREAAAAAAIADPVQAVAVSSLGEAMVPVSRDRRILGPSIVSNFDLRGAEYLEGLRENLDDGRVYRINGNTLGNNYSLTKLMWVRDHRPELYQQTYKFLLWGSFVSYMLGAQPAVDFSLANRSLLFDIQAERWSDVILGLAGLDGDKLPRTVPSTTVIGQVSAAAGEELGLPPGAAIVAGAHDQCANAVGCGAIREGQAAFSLGTFACITPVYRQPRDPELMIARGLNTQHHAVPGHFVSFIYNQAGSVVKWYRDTFAAAAGERAAYADLIAEIPDRPSHVVVLPHFSTTGPPRFIADTSGVIAGLRLETKRGEILKGILEGTNFYLKACVDALPPTGIGISDYRVVGGGSRSDAWVQLCADILGRPCVRPQVAEAGALGAAIIAGVGAGHLPSYAAGVERLVALGERFEPEPALHAAYGERFALYERLGPLLSDYLADLALKRV